MRRTLSSSSLTHHPSARIVLGLFNGLCFLRFGRQVGQEYGKAVAGWLYLLTAVQFHLPFYASRTLPNTFALGLGMEWGRSWDRILADHLGFPTFSAAVVCSVVEERPLLAAGIPRHRHRCV